MAQQLGDLQKIDNTKDPTPGKGLALDDRGQVPRRLLHPHALLTAFPVDPFDGEIVFFDSGTEGRVFQFRYNSGSASAHKWEFVGGGFLINEIRQGAPETTTSTSFTDLATAGPTFTIPTGLSGDWFLEGGSRMENNTGGAFSIASFYLDAAPAENDSFVNESGTGNSDAATVSRSVLRNVSAADVIKLQYRVTAGTGSFFRCWLRGHPVRCG